MSNNGVTISVSDDDPEDPSSRMRPRFRRKRKNPGSRSRPDFTRRIVAKLLKWWPALLLLPAACLLIYEAIKIGDGEIRNPPSARKSDHVATQSSKDKPLGNLNKLDPTTRVVGGVRERCLKLLPPEELELLKIPNLMDSRSPLKELVYTMETDGASKEGTFNLSMVYLEGSRFNLFTGNQTLEQRNQEFKVTEKANVHCGFYSEIGGFRISDEDKIYMKTCQVVVSTCAFGGGDDLYQPIGMSETSLRKVCYVAFWDEITLTTQEAQGNKVDDNHFIGKWRVIIVRDLPFRDQRLNGKIPKMLPHRLFPNARYSIWVDSKSQFRRDPLGVLEALLWRSNHELAISEHGARSSVYDEAKAVVKKNKAPPEEVEVQLAQYRHDGLPEDKRFNGKKALAEASIIVREHTPVTNLFMCLWFNEVVRFTSRDQLSFPYILWRLKGLTRINMFPVCTRKDLVNSMGHIRKAKPLTN
ncbi:probable hexosyltransferase MUCI70 [Salvia miltiorrhiza]|uniref:probable hexosyltransferase MUCI70 n=1 Tax=Salvia miltiorrhiza TaxID=226208 RepID=UPI0025ABFB15|nr:probable hexosyltransferase MUCI70 [Salvia miltiorrhiza]